MSATTHTIVRAAAAETLADGPTSSVALLADGEHTAGATTINRAFLAVGSPGGAGSPP